MACQSTMIGASVTSTGFAAESIVKVLWTATAYAADSVGLVM